MSSNSREKASSTSSSAADDTKRGAKKSSDIVLSSINCYAIDDADDHSFSIADDTKRAMKSDIVVPLVNHYATEDDDDHSSYYSAHTMFATNSDIVGSSAYAYGTDDDDGADLLYADLTALSIQPTLSSSPTQSTTPSSPSPTSSPLSWHLWRYNCRDFPIHKKHNPRHCPPSCAYCTQVNNLRRECPDARDECPERWLCYFEPGRAFDDVQIVLEYVKRDTEDVLPGKLARHVFFDHKLGTAFFRAGIEPIAEGPDNRDGGSFDLMLFASTSAANLRIENIDAIFVHTMQLIAELPESTQKCINGVFYYCKIHPGITLSSRTYGPYGNYRNLPFIGKLEVWIGDIKQEQLVHRELISKINVEIQRLDIHPNARRDFKFINRYKLWEAQELRKMKEDGRDISMKMRIPLANGSN